MSYNATIIGLCTLAIIVLQPPLFWHAHTRNLPAVILILWLLIINIINIINAAIWSGSDFMSTWDGKVWCDIAIKIDTGASVGIPCAVTDIVYNLHTILRATTVLENWNSYRKMIKDLLICLLSPIIVMATSYILQVFRYSILRYNGCQNAFSNTWITLLLYQLWIMLWAIFAAFYSLLVLFVFYKKRKDVKDILYCTNSGLNITRFARLLILCFVIILIMLPLSLYGLIQNAQNLEGHYSFKSTHSKALWNVIIKIDLGKPLYTVWIYVLASYLVFLVFGLGSDALSMYVNFLRTIGLGFIVDYMNNFSKRKRETRIGKLLNYMLNSNTSGHTSFSQESNVEYNCYLNENLLDSKIPNTQIYVNYDMPKTKEDHFYNKFRKKCYDLESKCLEHEINIDDGEYIPYLGDEISKEEQLLLYGIRIENETDSLKGCHNSKNMKFSNLEENIMQELEDLDSEEIRRDLVENPFTTPTTQAFSTETSESQFI